MASTAYGERAYLKAAKRSGLVWSEYAYLTAIALAALIAVEPFGGELGTHPETKHLPLLLTLPVVALSLAGRRLRVPESGPIASRVLKAAWPFMLLAFLIVSGSAYARWVDGEQNTFLNIGLYMLLVFFAAAMVLQSQAPEALLRAHFRILLVAGLFMSAWLIFYFRTTQIYHEQIFLIVPLAVYCALAPKNRLLVFFGAAFFLSMALFSAKNTAYLVALLVLLYLIVIVWFPRLRQKTPLHRVGGYYLVFVALLLIAGLLFFLLSSRETYLPSGNINYRSYTYGLAWQQFLESPLWGTLFAAKAVEKFTLYSIGIAGNFLPTHSDIMDLLANGGLIGIGLWLLGLFFVGRAAYRSLLKPLAQPWAAYAYSLIALSLAGIVVCAFNPILVHTGMAYLLWTNLGLLLGLALRFAGPAHQSPGNPAKWRAGR